jgi:hypothetical protein
MMAFSDAGKIRSRVSPYLLLEIAPAKGAAPLQIPVKLQNMVGPLVTLEAQQAWGLMGPEHLSGLPGKLRLMSADDPQAMEISGNLVWCRHSGKDQENLLLGLELAKADAVARQLLQDRLVHTPKDIVGLWEQFDQKPQAQPAPGLADQKVYFLGMGLLIAGLTCQLGSPHWKLFGWVLWFFGSLGMAGKSIWNLWQRRNVR